MHISGNLLTLLVIIPVAVVLILGLANTLRGGSPNKSQMFMRWRIGLQFIAIVIIMGVLWFRGT